MTLTLDPTLELSDSGDGSHYTVTLQDPSREIQRGPVPLMRQDSEYFAVFEPDPESRLFELKTVTVWEGMKEYGTWGFTSLLPHRWVAPSDTVKVTWL